MSATIIACFSLGVSIAAFIYPVVLRFWLEKPKLTISLRNIKFRPRDSLTQNIMQLLLINEGYRPLIISRIIYDSKNGGKGDCGIYNILKVKGKEQEMVLPKLLKPAECFEYNFKHIAMMKEVKTISIIDSRGKEHKISEKDLDNFVQHGVCCGADLFKPSKKERVKWKLKKFWRWIVKFWNKLTTFFKSWRF
jgi:hypothetical protein